MIRAATIYQREIDEAYIQNVTCPHCESIVNVKLSRSEQIGTILRIPFARMTVLYYSICPRCNIKYILNKQNYKKILYSASQRNDWNSACRYCLEKEKTKSNKNIMRSPKNVIIASVLSLIFGLFGMQNLYMGHKKRFLINISLLILSIIMFALAVVTLTNLLVFPCVAGIATNVYWGLIDFFRILSGHAKDSNGRYLLTNNQYKKRVLIHSQLHEKNI